MHNNSPEIAGADKQQQQNSEQEKISPVGAKKSEGGVGLNAALTDERKSFSEKVNYLLTSWEYVGSHILTSKSTENDARALIEWASSYTISFVLKGEWGKLPRVTTTHLTKLLERCVEALGTYNNCEDEKKHCLFLAKFVQSPWNTPPLTDILDGKSIPEKEEDDFCCQEKGHMLTMRLQTLCEDHCEDFAVKLAEACVRSLNRNDRLRSLSRPDEVEYMIDVYIVLMSKLKRTHLVVKQLKSMELNDTLELMQRLIGEKPTKYGTSRVWRNSSKAAVLVAQYLVTAGMVKPVEEVGYVTLEKILNSWALLHANDKDQSALPGIIRKLIEPAGSATHIYIFCEVLIRHFGTSMKPLVIELYIRGLTTDMNVLENQKSNPNREKLQETERRMAQEILKLADYVRDNVVIARECVLTAFSLHPTQDCYDRIKKLAVASGKITEEGLKEDMPKTDNTSKSKNTEESIRIKRESSETSMVEENSSLQYNVSTSVADAVSSTTLVERNSALHKEGEASLMSIDVPTSIVAQSSTTLAGQVSTSPKMQTPSTSMKGSSESSSTSREVSSTTPEVSSTTSKSVPSLVQSGVEIKLELSESELSSSVDASDKCHSTVKKCNDNSETTNVCSSAEALILIKGEAVTGSANYDERAVPSHVLDSEKLGISAQLCDDLYVVLSSQRYHILNWWSDWKELSELCERYMQNADEMRSTNRELKYLNIDYSQFKDKPINDDDLHYGIEKGYEQWEDSDYSESANDFGEETSQSLEYSSNDENASSRPRKRARPPKTRDEESELADEKKKRKRKPKKALMLVKQTNSEHQQVEPMDLTEKKIKKVTNRVPKSKKITVGLGGIIMDENIKPKTYRGKKRPNGVENQIDVSNNLCNSHCMPSNHCSMANNNSNNHCSMINSNSHCNMINSSLSSATAFKTAQLIIPEKRSDPNVIKSLRMFRPQNKRPINGEIIIKTEKPEEKVEIKEEQLPQAVDRTLQHNINIKKFAPMLSTLNLNPKIPLRRVDDQLPKYQLKKVVSIKKLKDGLKYVRKRIPMHIPDKNQSPVNGFSKKASLVKRTHNCDSQKDNFKILTNNVPGMSSMEFSCVPRMEQTVQIVQLSRNMSQSPNSSTTASNTSPRVISRTLVQQPGTPSSGGQDSGVGMSPTAQTPPTTTGSSASSIQDIGEEASQPPIASPAQVETLSNSTPVETVDPAQTVALAVLAGQHRINHQTIKKTTNSTGEQQQHHRPTQQFVLQKPDGTFQLVSSNLVSGQRGILALQSDGSIGFGRQPQVTVGPNNPANKTPTRNAQSLPKFQHAFGKNICSLSPNDSTTPQATSSSTSNEQIHETPAQQQPAPQQQQPQQQPPQQQQHRIIKTGVNTIKTIQATATNLQVSPGTRQILNLVQTATAAASGNASGTGQTLQLCSTGTPGVIYTHKLPVSLAGGGQQTSQLISIPTTSLGGNSNRTPVQVKLNIIRTTPFRATTSAAAGTIQAVLASRLQQQVAAAAAAQQQQQPPQQQSQQQSPLPIDRSMMNETYASDTLEQLREFEDVLEQIREKGTGNNVNCQGVQSNDESSQTQPATPTPINQHQVVNINRQLISATQTPTTTTATDTTITAFSNVSTNNVTFQNQADQQQTSQPQSQIQQPQVFQQKVAVMYTSQANSNVSVSSAPKITNSPVVVVTSYCQPAASPALSVTSQSSSSPCVTPAPASSVSSSTGSTSKSTQSQAKSKKSAPKTVKVNPQNTAKSAPLPKPQQKTQEDPETTQRIYAILGQYAEQLRNSPDLNNKPAPRRRSNPPTNPSQPGKRKKSGSTGGSKSKSGNGSGQQTSEPSPSADDAGRTMGSEDSSGGGGMGGSNSGMHVQDSPAYSGSEDTLAGSNNNSQSAANDNAVLGSLSESRTGNITSDSNDSVEVNMKRRNLIFAEPNTGQARAVIVQEGSVMQSTTASSVSEALASVTNKMTAGTAVLVSGTNLMLPMNFVKSGQQITVVSGGSKLLAAVPAMRTGGTTTMPNAFVLQSLLSQANKVMQQQKHQQRVLVQTSSSDYKDASQTSGVITSNPQRIFNSIVKNEQKVVCVAATAPKIETLDSHKTTFALAFASQDRKDIKSEVKEEDSVRDVKQEIKQEMDDNAVDQLQHLEESEQSASAVDMANDDIKAEPSQLVAMKKESTSALSTTENPTTAVTTTITTTTQTNSTTFLVSGGPCSSDSQESSIQAASMENSNASSSLDGVKVENGILCGNARLQEAWEPESKASPETPWRYMPTSNIDQSKVFTQPLTDNSTVLQIINKGQAIEMSGSGVFQAKKYNYNSITAVDQPYAKFVNNKLAQNKLANQEKIMERKQLLLERELRLQKSLSEECEDLGVDEPSTSDLFPGADILFDTNNSPADDQLSQESVSSQVMSGSKTYNAPGNTSPYSKTIDAVVAGNITPSPITTQTTVVEPKKKTPAQRRTTKPSQPRRKRTNESSVNKSQAGANPNKQSRLNLNVQSSQNQVSNSNSEMLKLLPVVVNADSKEKNHQSPSNGSTNTNIDILTKLPNVRVELEPISNMTSLVSSSSRLNNAIVNDDDGNLNLLEDNATNVALNSPQSPTTGGPLLTSTHKFTYINNRNKFQQLQQRLTPMVKQVRSADFFNVDTRSSSWESSVSEQTRSSLEDDEEFNEADESGANLGMLDCTNQLTVNMNNGLQEAVIRSNLPTVKITPLDHVVFTNKKKTIVRRPSVNHKDVQKSQLAKTNINSSGKKLKTLTPSPLLSQSTAMITSENEATTPSPTPSSIGDTKQDTLCASDDDITILTSSNEGHCTAAGQRRASQRGTTKKSGCTCCNGSTSQERPKKKAKGTNIHQQHFNVTVHQDLATTNVTAQPLSTMTKIVKKPQSQPALQQQQIKQQNPKQINKKR